MHKHNRVRVVLAAAAFAAIFSITWAADADNSSPWFDSNLAIQKQADAGTLPSSLNGNIDCFPENSGCAVATPYGSSQDVSVKLTDKHYPVQSYIEGRQRFIAVPNSSAFITYTANAPYGLYMYFNHSFTGSAKLMNNYGQIYYQITRPPDGKLADKNGRLLAGDPGSMSFSSNGRWMVISEPNVAVLRVNLDTYEVLPFAPGLGYSGGLDPAPKTAITNDGRYAIVASKTAGRFELYDLGTCGPAPQSINGPVSCQSRDLAALMRRQFPAYTYIAQARFLNDDSAAFYASYPPAPGARLGRFVISNGGNPPRIDYLALGDSYISGEGAFDYAPGTDTADNLCHLSYLSYPLLIGGDLQFDSYHSVACSGATTDDITDSSPLYVSQANKKERVTRAVWDAKGQSALALSSFLPGYVDQLDFVRAYQPKSITMSIGGNDMGFSDILTKCVMPELSNNTCYSTYEDRLELVRLVNGTVFNNLVKTYSALKTAGPPDTRVYAIGYPQIAKAGGDCAVNVHLNNDELIFAQQLVEYLDGVIAQAAARSGVYYVDTQDALNGHRLCEAGPGQAAMNGLTLGNDRPINDLGPIGDESYHPNALGYRLLEAAVLAATDNLTAPMPAPDPAAAPPTENSLLFLDVPRGGRDVNTTQVDDSISDDLVYKEVPVNISIHGSSHALGPATTLTAQLHSDPISLGTYTTDDTGDLSAQITIPAYAPAGYHTLHFYGPNINGQKIDVYKNLWVACSADDLDCDGEADTTQACVGIPPAGQDYDRDQIDDACDADITTAPKASSRPLNQAIYSDTASVKINPLKINPSQETAGDQSTPAVLAESTQKKSEAVSRPTAENSGGVSLTYSAGAAVLVGLAVLAGRKLFQKF